METKKNISELEKKYGKIEQVTFLDSEGKNPCIAYFREATTITKMDCFDLYFQSKAKAGRTLFDATILQESDKRVFITNNDLKNPQEDVFYCAAVLHCINKVERFGGLIKKK